MKRVKETEYKWKMQNPTNDTGNVENARNADIQ